MINISNLKIVDEYEKQDKSIVNKFNDNLRSTLHVNTVYDRLDANFDWLELIEDTMRYLDNIYRNPNRFIINEEEVVKIELARRVTVESIRHLAKNTNLIQDIIDEEVKPNKILNINKEESFNTYENKLIYTLIHRLRDFLELKKKENIQASSLKDYKKLEYIGKSIVGQEKINITLTVDTKIDIKNDPDDGELTVAERIAKIESEMVMLCRTEAYQELKKKNVALVIPPIKKTNVILKNNNFKYAMKLWHFLQENVDAQAERVKENKNYEDTGILKEYINDTFLLDYVAMLTISKEYEGKELQDLQVEDITNSLIQRIVELNADLPQDKIEELIGTKILMVKAKRTANLAEIQSAFSKQIKVYLEKIENFKFESESGA